MSEFFLPSFEFVPKKVKEVIIQYGAETLFYKDVPIEHRVYTLLRLLNIPPSMKGYTYIKYILETYTITEYKYTLPSLKKSIFLKVSEIYSTTPQRVERCIRTAIEKVEENCEPIIYSYFFSNNNKITNAEFLSQLIEFLKIINK